MPEEPHIRILWRVAGGHIHCRVFSGKSAATTHGKNGDLTFDVREWTDGVRAMLSRIAEVREDAESGR